MNFSSFIGTNFWLCEVPEDELPLYKDWKIEESPDGNYIGVSIISYILSQRDQRLKPVLLFDHSDYFGDPEINSPFINRVGSSIFLFERKISD